MKNKFQKIVFLIASVGFINSAHAYKFVIFNDEMSTNTSSKVVELIKNTYPFNTLNVEFEIVKLSSEELSCKSTNGIDRLITCDKVSNFQKKAKDRGGDQAMIVKNLPKYGGSSGVGGGVPVITSSSSPRVMLHEFLHTLGLSDEYEYKDEEAKTYCSDATNTPNTTFIIPLEPYGGDGSARRAHSGKIPWFGDIKQEMPITNSNGMRLGTGNVDFKKQNIPNPDKIASMLDLGFGLYRGKVCNQFKPVKPSWHPGSRATIMENADAGLGAPLEKIVKEIMIKKGATQKMQIIEPPTVVLQPSHTAALPTATAEPASDVDNSSRNLFKGFFGWIKTLIEQTGNGTTR